MNDENEKYFIISKNQIKWVTNANKISVHYSIPFIPDF